KSSLLGEDITSIPWLNNQALKSVLYISFGSLATITEEEVLAHPSTGAFWTHCGWNSTLESICEGVPMICAPSFGDQLVNARYVSDVWKVGIHLEGKMERGEIERAVKKLMADDEEGKEIRARIGDLKEKMELCLEMGGSSYEAVDQLVDHILIFCISGGGGR
ncbi:UDP-glycosyltransferase 76B1, partial [Linum grandiflorum]